MGRTPLVSLALVLPCLAGSYSALAAEGLVQGESNLLIPVRSKAVRLLNASLELIIKDEPECHSITIRGQTIWNYLGKSVPTHLAETGARKPCSGDRTGNPPELISTYESKGSYEMEAVKPARFHHLALPFRRTSFFFAGKNDFEWADHPGIADTRLLAEGHLVPQATVHVPGKMPSEASRNELRFAIPFFQGSPTGIQVSSQVGILSLPYISSVPSSEAPCWWCKEETPMEGVRQAFEKADRWAAPAPRRISLAVRSTTRMPVPFLHPHGGHLACVGAQALHFRWSEEFPSAAIEVHFPQARSELPKTLAKGEADTWYRALRHAAGNRLTVECSVNEAWKELLSADAQILQDLRNQTLPCVKTCENDS